MSARSSPPATLNPYHAPTAAEPFSWSELFTSKVRFVVEADRTYDVHVEFNHWNGMETYSVHGVEQRLVDNKWPWLRQRILLNDQPHTVLEFRSWFFPLFPVRVSLNGRTYVRSLFPGFLRKLVLTSFAAGLSFGSIYVLLDINGWLG